MCNQMPYLISLDLSFNQFEGSIPSDLRNCMYLQTLQLQGNRLRGQIPGELGLLPRLFNLNLSSNALSGPIPSSFFNRSIVAQIPFNASAFGNNPLLCGPPLSSKCAPSQNRFVLASLVGVLIGLILSVTLPFLLVLAFLRFRPLLHRHNHHHHHVHAEPAKVKSSWKLCGILQQPHTSNHNGNTRSLPMFETHLRLTWEELQHATKAFSPARIIGKGGSSTVYKGKLLNGRMIAVKLLHNDELGFLHTPTQLFETELAVLGKLRHRNLVRILGYFYNLERMAIIMDYMPAGSLDALLLHQRGCGNNSTGFGWKERLGILMGIADGLAYLHHEYDGKVSIIHTDLKPANVLLDENMQAHIADFGIATFANAISTSNSKGLSKGQVLPVPFAWSLGYTAPECVQQGVVSRKGDVFSFGIIVLEVITGERPSSDKLKEGESLVEWVSKALAVEGMMEQVLAPILLRPHEVARWGEDISATLRMGCCCASLARANRPDMSTVVTFLRELSGNLVQHY